MSSSGPQPPSFSASASVGSNGTEKVATIALDCKPSTPVVCNGMDIRVRSGENSTTLHVEENGRITRTDIGKGPIQFGEIKDRKLAAEIILAAKGILNAGGKEETLRANEIVTLIDSHAPRVSVSPLPALDR